MKTIYHALATLIIASLSSGFIFGQNIVEKQINGNTYIITSHPDQSKCISRKGDLGYEDITKRCEYVDAEFKGKMSLGDVFKDVLPSYKISTWGGENKTIAVIVFSDTSGQIHGVQFLMRKVAFSYNDSDPSAITLSELSQIEKKIKENSSLRVKMSCTDVNYVSLMSVVRFNQLAGR